MKEIENCDKLYTLRKKEVLDIKETNNEAIKEIDGVEETLQEVVVEDAEVTTDLDQKDVHTETRVQEEKGAPDFTVRNTRDFAWESLASVEQSRQNELISEIYNLMRRPDANRLEAIKAEWSSLPSDSDDSMIEEKFQTALKTYDERTKRVIEALDIKKVLVSKAEALKDSENFQKTAHALQELQKEWKAAGFAGVDVDQDLWEAFRAANDHFFNRRQAYFETMGEQRDEAKTIKEALILEAQAIQDSEEWKETSSLMRDLMDRWKEAGYAGREHDDHLWEQFNDARQKFYQRQTAFFDDMRERQAKAREIKLNLIDEARTLSSSSSFETDRAKMDALFEQWKEAGSAGRKFEQGLWDEFKAHQDVFFEQMKSFNASQSVDHRNILEEELERFQVRINALDNMVAMIDVKLDQLSNQTVTDDITHEMQTLNESKEEHLKSIASYKETMRDLEQQLSKL